ncbi:hypothetical protein LCGC14_1969640 [marine sediment metagenome]|uniref:Uncharacterized protein n=1 Tax=marine sediment metagenome TaxID=412755 RepID=A0A0F9HQH8_9ZZZZ
MPEETPPTVVGEDTEGGEEASDTASREPSDESTVAQQSEDIPDWQPGSAISLALERTTKLEERLATVEQHTANAAEQVSVLLITIGSSNKTILRLEDQLRKLEQRFTQRFGAGYDHCRKCGRRVKPGDGDHPACGGSAPR